MKQTIDRRNFIKSCGCFAAGTVASRLLPSAYGAPDVSVPTVWGANYVPTRRMNTYQVWWRFDADQLNQQIGFAPRINLNSLRMWLSPERWWEAPDETQQQMDTLLAIAHRHNIKILISLFKNCGADPNVEQPVDVFDESPVTGYEVHSPSRDILNDPSQWGPCYEYVDWFMDRYKNDGRLLAIEIMNEPGLYKKKNEETFALAMLDRAMKQKGALKLSMGCVALGHNQVYVDHGIEIMQSHPNFLGSEKQFHSYNKQRLELERKTGLPYIASEWQRIRAGGLGWGGVFPAGDEWKPAYHTLAPLFHRHRINGHFWSLMLRPSYLKVHDEVRWMNGVFHEDGRVYSERDAQSIANDSTLSFEEQPDWPDWAAANGPRLQRFLQQREAANAS